MTLPTPEEMAEEKYPTKGEHSTSAAEHDLVVYGAILWAIRADREAIAKVVEEMGEGGSEGYALACRDIAMILRAPQ